MAYQPLTRWWCCPCAVNVSPDVAAPVSSVYQPPAVPGQQASGVYEQGARFDPSKRASIPVSHVIYAVHQKPCAPVLLTILLY